MSPQRQTVRAKCSRRMALNSLVIGVLLGSAAQFTGPAHADADYNTSRFTVLRDGNEIGTNTITVSRNGEETTVQIVTHVKITFAFVTVYRFDQNETEQWVGSQLLAMNALTDDNGTVHHTTANDHEGEIVVKGDKNSTLAANAFPVSLWNPDLLKRGNGFDPQDGGTVPVSLVDRGEENLVLQGHAERAHHYVLTTTFPQDVWYDDSHRLVKLEMKGPDGSAISYQLN
jgi:hypothetical protein